MGVVVELALVFQPFPCLLPFSASSAVRCFVVAAGRKEHSGKGKGGS